MKQKSHLIAKKNIAQRNRLLEYKAKLQLNEGTCWFSVREAVNDKKEEGISITQELLNSIQITDFSPYNDEVLFYRLKRYTRKTKLFHP